jgi:flagellar hook-associated protein 2
MASGSISSPGLGSNLDVSGIVSKLMALESQPLTQLDAREGTLQANISTFGQIKSTISSVQAAVSALKTSVLTPTYRTAASDPSVVSARTSDGVASSSHDISISAIAQAQRIVSTGQTSRTAAIGTGTATTLTITFGTISGGTLGSNTGLYSGAAFTANPDTQSVTINIDGTNNTLQGIRDAINAASAGVTASIVSDGSATPNRLVIQSNATGLMNSIKLEVTGDATLQTLLAYDPAGLQNLSQLQAAQSAQLSVDGVPITSASNSVSGVIDSLAFDLKAAGSATVSVNRDTTPIATALTQLVKAYNDASSAIAEATKKGANLQGDTGTISMLARLRAELGGLRVGFGSYSSLSQLGVSFERDGSLTFDSSKLQSALNDHFADATAMIGGCATALANATDGMLGPNGILQSRTDGISRSIKDIDGRRAALSQRLDQIQARYLAQFNALDTMISSLKQTSTFLDQQLANLPKINN